jgi:hypothetical protein
MDTLCLIPINNGMELCGNFLCKIHKENEYNPYISYNETELCGYLLQENEPIISITKKRKKKYGFRTDNEIANRSCGFFGSSKGNLCCFPKIKGSNSCKTHNDLVRTKETTTSIGDFPCYYQYDLNKIIKKYPLIKDINLLQTKLYCGNKTSNYNGLCNFHYNSQICPCNKHSSYELDLYISMNEKLKDLLFNNDIYSNLFKFLDNSTIKLLNSSNVYHRNINKTLTKSFNFSQSDSHVDIVQFIMIQLYYIKTSNNKEYKLFECYKIFDYLIKNKLFLIKNIKYSLIMINKLLEFKREEQFPIEKCDYYIKELFNIEPKNIYLLEKRLNKWPGKTREGKFCKKCIKLSENNYCYHHRG